MSFRILSLDGGGSWALLEAMALEQLFPNLTGHQILAHFDLAAANSGGSIVLAGLMLNMEPTRIRGLFENRDKRAAIFHKKSWFGQLLAKLQVFPRYETEQKRAGLRDVMEAGGDVLLSEWPEQPGWPTGPSGAPTRSLIMAFNYDSLREEFLRSYRLKETGATADDIALVDAVNASTNAPVQFFDKPAVVGFGRFWDGAMGGYNNPLLAAVVDALALGIPTSEICALSLGTGTVRLVGREHAPSGTQPALVAATPRPWFVTNIVRASGAIVDDPPDAATYAAHVLLGHKPTEMGRVVRMSPVVRPVLDGARWTYPSGLRPPVFEKLTKLGMDAVEDEQVKLIKALGVAWIEGSVPNQPIRMRSNLSPDPGDGTFAAAAARWTTLK